MANLPPICPPIGGTPMSGFTPNPHHQRQIESEAAASDGLKVLELAVDYCKSKPDSTATDVVAAAQAFFDLMQRLRSA